MSEAQEKGKRHRWFRLLVRCCALVIAVILVLPVLPWSWTSLAYPSLSPYILICSAVATRAIGLATLVGLPVLAIVLVRRRFFCRYACPVGLLCEYTGRLRRKKEKEPVFQIGPTVVRGRKKGTGPICRNGPEGASHKLDLSPFSASRSDGAARKRNVFSFSVPVAKLPPIGRWVALLTFGGALFGYPFFLWLDPLAIFHGVFTLYHDPLSLAGQVSAVVLGVVLSISLLLPGAWCTRLCPLGATQDLLAMPQRLFRRVKLPVDRSPADLKWFTARRSFFSVALGAVWLGLGGRWTPAAWMRLPRVRSRLLRPPGSLDEERFTGSCIRCGNCIRACPSGIIQPDLGSEGIAGFLAPKISFDDDYCRKECHQCTQVCPSGAIARLTLEEKNKAPIGFAKLELQHCLLWNGAGECGLCETECPFGAISTFWDPEQGDSLIVDRDKCTGCGVCQLKCPGTNEWERENSDEPIPVRKAIEVRP